MTLLIRFGRLGALVVLALIVFTESSRATDPAPAQPTAAPPGAAPEKEWHFALAPYLWATALSGSVRVDGLQADIDVTFRDIFKHLNGALMGSAEINHGRFSLLVDGVAAFLQVDESYGPETKNLGPATFQQGPVQVTVPSVPVKIGPADLDSHVDLIAVEAVLAYQVFSSSFSEMAGAPAANDPRRLQLDLYGGGRYWNVNLRNSLDISPAQVSGFAVQPSIPRLPRLKLKGLQVPGFDIGGRNDDFDTVEAWVDPVIGARIRVAITDRIDFTTIGDIGGFGVGNSSNLSWSAWGLVGYRLSDSWELKAGYRALAVRRSQETVGSDLIMHGALFGALFRF